MIPTVNAHVLLQLLRRVSVFLHMLTHPNPVPLTACSDIHSINVAGCINIGDRAVTAMSTKLELDSVDISYCPNITDDAVGELLSGNELL